MRIFTSRRNRPLTILAVSPGWVAAGNDRTGSRNGGLEVWPLQGGAVVQLLPLKERVHSVAFDPAGRLFWSDDATLRRTELSSDMEDFVPAADFYHSRFALSADGRYLLACSSVNQCGGLSAWEKQHDGGFHSLWQEGLHEFHWYDGPTLSVDGLLAAVFESSPTADMRGGTTDIVLRQTGSRKPIHVLRPDKPRELLTLHLTSGGLLLGLATHGVNVWDTQTGQPVTTIQNPTQQPELTALAVHPGGQWIATADHDSIVRFWDVETFRQVAAFDWQLGPLRSLAFAPDGTLAAAGTSDGRVVVWDVDL